MNYYSIEISDDLKVIGYYPQTEFKDGYNPRENGCYNVHRNSFPDFVPNYELRLNQKANLTNFLPVVGIGFGFIVDEKVRQIFKEHFLPPTLFIQQKFIITMRFWIIIGFIVFLMIFGN